MAKVKKSISLDADVYDWAVEVAATLDDRSPSYVINRACKKVMAQTAKPEKVEINRKSSLSVNAVVKLWNDMFVDTYATQMELITDTRRKTIQSRIKNQFHDIKAWTEYFELIKQNDFLMGKTHSKDRKPFKISLEWVCKPANLAKILEGYYHGRLQSIKVS